MTAKYAKWKQSQTGTSDIHEKLVATETGFWWRYV
jgi:hypothetical protein